MRQTSSAPTEFYFMHVTTRINGGAIWSTAECFHHCGVALLSVNHAVRIIASARQMHGLRP